MAYQDTIQYKTKTIQTGEYLPLTTNAVITINKSYSNTTDADIRTMLANGQYLVARLLSYNGYDSSTFMAMGAVEDDNTSRIWKPSTPTITPTGSILFNMEFTFNKIAEDTSFSVIPKDVTIFKWFATAQSVNSIVINSWCPYIMQMFNTIYGMQQSEYAALYGKVQLSNITIDIKL